MCLWTTKILNMWWRMGLQCGATFFVQTYVWTRPLWRASFLISFSGFQTKALKLWWAQSCEMSPNLGGRKLCWYFLWFVRYEGNLFWSQNPSKFWGLNFVSWLKCVKCRLLQYCGGALRSNCEPPQGNTLLTWLWGTLYNWFLNMPLCVIVGSTWIPEKYG